MTRNSVRQETSGNAEGKLEANENIVFAQSDNLRIFKIENQEGKSTKLQLQHEFGVGDQIIDVLRVPTPKPSLNQLQTMLAAKQAKTTKTRGRPSARQQAASST